MTDNIPQLDIKSIKGIFDLSDTEDISNKTTKARKIYREHEKQNMLQRCIRGITGRNKHEELETGNNISIALEHLNQLTNQLSDEVARNGNRILENTSHLSINARAITKLNNDFIALSEDHETLKNQFKELIVKQKEYNKSFQQAINGLESQQDIDRIATAWQNEQLFKGYHPVIQTALFIDCIQQNWGDVLASNPDKIEYLKNKASIILKALYPEAKQAFRYKQGDFLISDSQLQDELQICLPEYNQTNAGFLTYKAINNNIPDWFDLKILGIPKFQIVETADTLVQELITEAGEN